MTAKKTTNKKTIEVTYELTLEDMLDIYGPKVTSEFIGVSEPAVRAMHKNDRNMLFRRKGEVFEYMEIKDWRHGSSHNK